MIPSTPRYKQADPRWSKDVLGFGPATIGRAGCMLVCLCEAARELRGVEVLPPFLNRVGINHSAFLHSSALTAKLGFLVGLKVGDKITANEPSLLRGAIGDALRDGGRSILHVDHTGDYTGDHFVLALREEHDASGFRRLVYADPATGREGQLDALNLEGVTTWGTVVKRYRVRSVRSVHAAV